VQVNKRLASRRHKWRRRPDCYRAI
jgi:hypothetical protein